MANYTLARPTDLKVKYELFKYPNYHGTHTVKYQAYVEGVFAAVFTGVLYIPKLDDELARQSVREDILNKYRQRDSIEGEFKLEI